MAPPLKHGASGAKQQVRGLDIHDNIWSCDVSWVKDGCPVGAVLLDESQGQFGRVYDSSIQGNTIVGSVGKRSTRARKAVAVADADRATLDFTDSLLFPNAPIGNQSSSCQLVGGTPTAFTIWTHDSATGPPWIPPLVLEVEFARNWTGTVACTADQSEPTTAAL